MLKKIDKAKLIERTLSATVLAPFAIAAIWFGGMAFLALIILCATVSLYEWVQLALKTKKPVLSVIVGVLYIGTAFLCCYEIRARFSPEIALLFISMVWMSDSSAYFFGQLIGGPKMAGSISPNKTWAGMAGAMIGPAVLCFIYLLFMPDFLSGISFTVADALMALVVGVLMGLVGQAGDLIVSSLKRRAGQKDSGQLIPGHGGLLDRVDAMMLSAPVFLFVVSEFITVFTGG